MPGGQNFDTLELSNLNRIRTGVHNMGIPKVVITAREIAGYGIGSIFLIRTTVAISYQIGINSLFALCAPYTIPPGEAVGMEIEKSIGNDGTFYYPKLDLLATTMVLKDVPTLSKAYEEDKNAIIDIRENLNITRVEVLRKKEITIHYQIQIPNLDQWDLNAIILQAKKNFLKSKAIESEPETI